MRFGRADAGEPEGGVCGRGGPSAGGRVARAPAAPVRLVLGARASDQPAGARRDARLPGAPGGQQPPRTHLHRRPQRARHQGVRLLGCAAPAPAPPR